MARAERVCWDLYQLPGLDSVQWSASFLWFAGTARLLDELSMHTVPVFSINIASLCSRSLTVVHVL